MPAATEGVRKSQSAPGTAAMRAVNRTALVLQALSSHRSGLTLSQLADATALPVSSCHRLVAALDREGFVRAQPRGRIFLGPLLTQLAAESGAPIAPEIRNAMETLASHLNVTVDVAVLDGESIRFIGQRPADRSLRSLSSVGVRFPLHCTGSGKAFLAGMDRAEAQALLPRRLPRLTAHSLTSRRALWRELDGVRATSIGVDREEHHLGIASLATLIPDSHGRTIAMSIVIPARRFYGREETLAASLVATSALVRRLSPSARRKSISV